MRLKNKVAIITGGGTGIGRGIALMFGKEGASVIICGRRVRPLEETVADIKRNGGEAIFIKADVSSSSQINNMVETALMKYGQIDILVNNAGIYLEDDVSSLEEKAWDAVINTDAKGVFLVSKAVIPHMIKQDGGKIINITSVAGLFGFEKSAAYCAAKGAVVNLTREMALDYGHHDIRVNAIAPGIIESDMTAPVLKNKDTKENFLKNTPLGRIGKPEDIAYAAVYLASDESSFMTGQTIVIDGGWTIH